MCRAGFAWQEEFWKSRDRTYDVNKINMGNREHPHCRPFLIVRSFSSPARSCNKGHKCRWLPSCRPQAPLDLL